MTPRPGRADARTHATSEPSQASAWSEDRLHRWLARRARPGVLAGPLGHDAAVLRRSPGRSVVCADLTVEGVHFQPELAPKRVGAKAASRALSDLAATAATPRALLLTLSAPRATPEAWMRAAIRGVIEAGDAEGAALVGGDLACVPGPRSLSVTALGELPGRRRAPGRDGARPGQVLVLTGPVGGSILGRHARFRPRIAAGRWLFAEGATAMMDVSDGLAWDAFRLARASGVRILLDEVPIHRDARRLAKRDGRSARWHALHDGEDHELLACVPRARMERLLADAPRVCPDLSVVGSVAAGRGLGIRRGEGYEEWDGKGGWRHGQ